MQGSPTFQANHFKAAKTLTLIVNTLLAENLPCMHRIKPERHINVAHFLL
jgi:hypothetical protein